MSNVNSILIEFINFSEYQFSKNIFFNYYNFMIEIMFSNEMKENNIHENYMMKSDNKLKDMNEINSDILKINLPVKVTENTDRDLKYFNLKNTEKNSKLRNFFNRSASNLPR